MKTEVKLPVGIENFEEIRKEGFYYVDKTALIRKLLKNWAKVNLFIRPRRFGKTLNMSMLRSFFEPGTDKGLFEGLEIAEEKELCDKYMGKFPVVFLSLKSVDGLTFEDAKNNLWEVIQKETRRLYFLAGSRRLSEFDRASFMTLTALKAEDALIRKSLALLTELLGRHYGGKVILLIDEYDVPLDKAFHHGYYEEMVSLLRGLFEQALKTNDALYFSVLSGCLRVTKESIFTGLNNFAVNTAADAEYGEEFGFTQDDVECLLRDYGLEKYMAAMKEWYDGYLFGNAHIYCPWDVLNYARKLLAEPESAPEAFWIHTSGNDLVRRFVDRADKTTQNEIECLIAGECIEKAVRMELTYHEIDESIDNLWSVLYLTGYLTRAGRSADGMYKLRIPNREIKEIFVSQIQDWFRENIAQDVQPVRALCRGVQEGKPEEVQRQLNIILGKMISVLDTGSRQGQRENFYHGLLLGLLRSRPGWFIYSNSESGEGFSDILIEFEDPDAGIVIELKYAPNISGLEKACADAMKQIREKRYDERLRNEGRIHIGAYGIAFYKKRCRVVYEKLEQSLMKTGEEQKV